MASPWEEAEEEGGREEWEEEAEGEGEGGESMGCCKWRVYRRSVSWSAQKAKKSIERRKENERKETSELTFDSPSPSPSSMSSSPSIEHNQGITVPTATVSLTATSDSCPMDPSSAERREVRGEEGAEETEREEEDELSSSSMEE